MAARCSPSPFPQQEEGGRMMRRFGISTCKKTPARSNGPLQTQNLLRSGNGTEASVWPVIRNIELAAQKPCQVQTLPLVQNNPDNNAGMLASYDGLKMIWPLCQSQGQDFHFALFGAGCAEQQVGWRNRWRGLSQRNLHRFGLHPDGDRRSGRVQARCCGPRLPLKSKKEAA